MGRYFGTDGFRGEANVTLTCDHAYKTGQFFGMYLNEKKRARGEAGNARVAVGRDTRISGGMLEAAFVSGLTFSGADAYMLGVTSTSSVSYIIGECGLDGGVMISASHNPYYDNGIKLFGGCGEKAEEEAVSLAEDFLDGKGAYTDKTEPALRGNIGRVVNFSGSRKKYIKFLISAGRRAGDYGGIKVGLDLANGSACTAAKEVFSALGVDARIISDKPDGLNINENCGSTHTEALGRYVRENGLFCGFAFDGDADRCVCVDENGRELNGDKILYICGRYLKDRGALAKDTVVTTVMSNMGLYRAFKKLGISHFATAVGDKNVREYIAANGFSLGGEQSGHIIFSEYLKTGDGILTALMVMEAAHYFGLPMSELCAPVKDFPQTLINVRAENDALGAECVRRAIENAEKRLGSCGRVLVRMSGTEPLLRVMAEAEDENECRRAAEEIAEAVRLFCGRN